MKVHDLDRWFVVLVAIAESDGHKSQQELSSQLMIDKVSMVRALDLLSAKGYVERINCPDDRRKHHIRLLPKAKPVVKAIKKTYAEVNALVLGPMSDRSQATFLREVQAMLERMPTEGMKPANLKYTKKLPK
jgi:DNA-binding MarR family transcriptional regulator